MMSPENAPVKCQLDGLRTRLAVYDVAGESVAAAEHCFYLPLRQPCSVAQVASKRFVCAAEKTSPAHTRGKMKRGGAQDGNNCPAASA